MTREFTREENDGSKTYTYAIEEKGILKTHNNKVKLNKTNIGIF